MVYRRRRSSRYRRRRYRPRRGYRRLRGGRRRFKKARRYSRGARLSVKLKTAEGAYDWNVYAESLAHFKSIPISINQCQGYDRFTQMYERFRINKVVVRITYQRIFANETQQYPVSQGPQVPFGATGVSPRFGWAIDHDDNEDPVEWEQLSQRENYKEVYMTNNKKVNIPVRPAVSVMAYKGLASTAYTPAFRKWIDSNDYATPHYGLKLAYTANWGPGCPTVHDINPAIGRFMIECDYYVSFAGLKRRDTNN